MVNIVNGRIKELRKHFDLTQDVFGKKLGIKKSAVSKIEKGENGVTDQMIKLMVKEFGVNESWLRTGEGEMKIEDCKDNRYLSNVGKLQRTDDETIMRWVNAIAETDPGILKEIEEFMKKLLETQED